MFVTNHVLSGMLVGRILKNRPGTAFLAGLTSHLVLDAVPHWGCRVSKLGPKERISERSGPSAQFVTMAKRDGVLGIIAIAAGTFAVERSARTAALSAMAGAVLLDLDKPFLYFLGFDPFPVVVRRLHAWVQNESPRGMSNELRFGFAFAAADVVTVVRARRTG